MPDFNAVRHVLSGGIGEFEQTIRGYTVNARVEVKTNIHINHIVTDDRFSLQGGYLSKKFYDPADEDITDWQGKLVYRLFIP